MNRFLAVLMAALLAAAPAQGIDCEQVVMELNTSLSPKLNEPELVEVLRTLNNSGNRHLPSRYVSKRQAKEAGWRPGQSLWNVHGLAGKSLGGDRFANREGRLPPARGAWREADLDYRGGHRNAKRLVFSRDGRRFVTVDHYNSFREVPACR